MGLIDGIIGMLDGLASGRISAQQVAFLRDQIKALAEEIADLKEENAKLMGQAADLTRQLNEARTPQEFIEYRGALFRRGPDGEFEIDAYCRFCKIPMISLMGVTPFTCDGCGRGINFTGSDIRGIIAKLPR